MNIWHHGQKLKDAIDREAGREPSYTVDIDIAREEIKRDLREAAEA